MLLPILGVLTGLAGSPSAGQFGKYGEETLDQIQREFFLRGSKLYAESATASGPTTASHAWPGAILLSALVSATEWNPKKYTPVLDEYANAFQAYWTTSGGTPGYDSNVNSLQTDRYYDDNAWIARDFTKAYKLTGEEKYKTWAIQAANFCWSGYSSELGGGIFWQENKKTSKNTCSNAPSASAFLMLFQLNLPNDWKDRAEGVYEWTHTHLRDPDNGLYWDSMNLKGTVDRTEWSYNTALMIDVASRLFQLTNDPKYKEQALQAESASEQRFVNADGSINSDGVFASLLIESWITRQELAPSPSLVGSAIPYALHALIQLHGNGRDENGHYGGSWARKPNPPLKKWDLINQAASAAAYFELANFLKGQGTDR